MRIWLLGRSTAQMNSDEFYTLTRLLDRRDLDSLDTLTANLDLDKGGARHIRFLSTYTDGEGEDAGVPEGSAPDGLPTLEVAAWPVKTLNS